MTDARATRVRALVIGENAEARATRVRALVIGENAEARATRVRVLVIADPDLKSDISLHFSHVF